MSYWGAGANAKYNISQAGNTGANYGSGGGGALLNVSASNVAGGNGAPGVIVVEEYA
jgi:hypothetical protein